MDRHSRSRSATPTNFIIETSLDHLGSAQAIQFKNALLQQAHKAPDYSKWHKQVEKGPISRLQRELQKLTYDPPPYCIVGPTSIHAADAPSYTAISVKDVRWVAAVSGPDGTPYAGGTFYINILIPSTYPFQPPKVSFLTRIYHCNVAPDTLQPRLAMLEDAWLSSCTIDTVLRAIVEQMQNPDPRNAAVDGLAELLTTNRQIYEATARDWTKRFAS